MSAQANIVVFDGAAPPVSHTLQPMGASRSVDGVLVAEWGERLTTVPVNAQVSLTARKRMLKSGQEQDSLTVKVPVMESVNGANAAGYTAAPQVAYENTFVITSYFSPRATVTERRLARQMAVNVFGGIATTVTPVATGVSAELFDSSISAS